MEERPPRSFGFADKREDDPITVDVDDDDNVVGCWGCGGRRTFGPSWVNGYGTALRLML